MSTATASRELLFTATEVARAAGTDYQTLRTLEPEGFGSPGHWRMRGGNVIYTARGVELLAGAFSKAGAEASAHSLRVMLSQRQETPSRALVGPRRKNESPDHPSWQDRADLQ